MKGYGIVRVNPLSDRVFSCMFKGMEASNVMRGLVNSVIEKVGDEPISEIVSMRSQYTQVPKHPRNCFGRLDVKAKGKDGEAIDMEVQLYDDENFLKREFFYGSKMATDAVGEGDGMDKMPKAKVIGLSDILLRDDTDDFISPIKLIYTNSPMSTAMDTLSIYNVELQRFRKVYNTLESISGEKERDDFFIQFMYLLTEGYKRDEEMEELARRDERLREFKGMYDVVNADQELRDWLEYESSARQMEKDRLLTVEHKAQREGYKLGHDEGKAEGKEESARETSLELFKMGLKPEAIAKAVKFPISDVKAWLGIS